MEIRRELPPNYELVDNPPHYSGEIKPIDFIEENLTPEEYEGFLKGNIIRYISRLGKKEDDLTDAKKAKWYLNRLIQMYHWADMNSCFKAVRDTIHTPSVFGDPE